MAAGWAVAARRLPQALDRPDDQPVRLAGVALAIPLTAILVLDASAFEVASLGTVYFLPFLLFALPAGVWVDRLRRRPILIVSDLGRALLLASIPIAYFARRADDLAAVRRRRSSSGTLTVFFDVSYQSYLPSLVRRDQLVSGNSLLEVTQERSADRRPRRCAASSSAPHGAIRHPRRRGQLPRLRRRSSRSARTEPEPEPAEHPNMRRELGEGLRYLSQHRVLAADLDHDRARRTSSGRWRRRSCSSTPCARSTCRRR